jgi:polysaccharide biosynthesis/export protein
VTLWLFPLMTSRLVLTFTAVLLAGAVPARDAVAQSSLPSTLPSAAQAQLLVQTRPDLVAQLRQRIQGSGLSRDQIAARLRAAGYPESLLEQVMGSGSGEGVTTSPDSLIAAVRALGLMDEVDAVALRRGALMSRAGQDPERADSAAGKRTAEYAPDGSTLFGYSLFSQPTTLFDPNLGGPVDASYRLGAGDQVVLILSGDVEAAYTLDVTREGFVAVPVVGPVPVASLTLGQLDALLKSRLARVYSGIGSTTRFTVSVARLRSNQVFVAGDVQQPGSYRISSAGTALTAVYAAGGPSERGSLRQVEIRRRGQPTQLLDVYDYLVRGDASRDVRLEQGDVIFVPTHGPRVRIAGGVVRPATYELRAGETLRDLVQSAGGFSDDASQRRLRIQRILPPTQRRGEGSDRIDLDVALPTAEAAGAVRLEAGDVIEVPRVSGRVRQRITVQGNVWQPGRQGIQPGETLTDAIRRAGGLKPDSYLGRVLISRLRADSTREQVSATLSSIDGTMQRPLILQEDDEITVFAVTDFRVARHVALTGAVRRPGRYTYRDGMTMRDLVLEAGGLLPSAALTEAEIARLPTQATSGQLAMTFRVPLDSTYVVGTGAAITPSGDVTLHPYDNVLILRQPDWQLQWSVTLSGEVRYPGVYALRTKTERLSDVIVRAGGLTASAYPAGVSFVRGEGTRSRVGVDLPSVLRNPKDRDNLLMQDGDSVYIPRYNALVTVRGAVNSPLAVPYEPGAPLSYYLQASGGATRNGDAKRTYIVQGNGKVVTRRRILGVLPSTPTPTPGSQIVVPSRDPGDKRDSLQLLTTMTQVIGSIVTLAVVLNRTR